jgi:hypothetical protein
MSLSAWEKHALESIEDRLTGSDPKLAALLTCFSRLGSGEAMPFRQRVRTRWWRLRRHSPRQRIRRGRMRRRPGRTGRWLSLPRAVVLLWLLTTFVMVTIAVLISLGSGAKTCTTPWAAVCARSLHARTPRGTAHASRGAARATRGAAHATATNPAAHVLG